MNIKIPVNCTAIVKIPQTDPDSVFEDNLPLRQSEFAKAIEVTGGKTICEIPSGEYTFKALFNK